MGEFYSLALHVDLRDSRKVTASMEPRESRRLSSILWHVLRLLASRLIEEYGADTFFAGDGGFCLVPHLGEELRDVRNALDDLLSVAKAYPTFVRAVAKPPLLDKVPAQLRFRRGISLIDDIPKLKSLRLDRLGSYTLANAIKHERGWIVPRESGEPDSITVWSKLAPIVAQNRDWQVEEAKPPNDPRVTVPESVCEVFRPTVNPARPEGEDDGASLGSGLLSRLVALEDCTIYGLRQGLRQGDRNAGLLAAFEPKSYLKETLTAIRDFLQRVFLGGAAVRVALFLPKGQMLHCTGTSAGEKHVTQDIPLQTVGSLAAHAYATGRTFLEADTHNPRAGSLFRFFDDQQKDRIRGILCVPIIESELRKVENEPFPRRSSPNTPRVLGVVSVDTAVPGAFARLEPNDGDAVVRLLQPLIRDLEIGILLGQYNLWSAVDAG